MINALFMYMYIWYENKFTSAEVGNKRHNMSLFMFQKFKNLISEKVILEVPIHKCALLQCIGFFITQTRLCNMQRFKGCKNDNFQMKKRRYFSFFCLKHMDTYDCEYGHVLEQNKKILYILVTQTLLHKSGA